LPPSNALVKTIRSSETDWTAGHAILAGLLVTGAVAASWNAWSDLLFIARKDEESSHVLVVPLALLWIVLVRRPSLRHCRPTGQWIGPTFVALGWLLWSAGYRHDIQAFWHGGAVLMAVGAALTVLGTDVLRKFWPAFLVLLFLVPVPGFLRQGIARPMQTITAQATQCVAELIGMRGVECWGNTLSLNGTQIAVAEACNGMRMIFTLLLVSFTFAFVTPLRGYVRFLIIAGSPLTAIFCNVLRLVPTLWVYGRYSHSTAETFHAVSGWIMLVVGFLMLFGIVELLRWLMIPVAPESLPAL
jgi:exosortase